MISLTHITRQHGHKILFIDASFQLDPGEKVGLVGPNGSGKTTLFRLIVGEESPDEGVVERPKRLSIGWFRQDATDAPVGNPTVLQTAMTGAGEVMTLGVELASLERRMEEAGDDFDEVLERYGDVQARYTDLGGYDLESRASAILAGLGLTQEQMTGRLTALSGGWRMRVELAKILLQRPDVLLLDEPTNHLDLESILWLEEFLRGYAGSVLMTCHDREVMDRVVKRIAEIEGGEIRSYTGNYAFYEKARAEDAARRESEFDKQVRV